MAEMKTFNGLEIVDAKARQNIEAQDTRLKEVEKFFEAADSNGVIDKLAEVQKYIEDDAQAAASLIQSIADVDAKVDAIELPTKVSELENDANYTDKTYVDNAVKNVEVDLTGYATEQWVEDKKYLTQHQSLAGLATETYVNEQIDAIEFPVTDISGKSDVGHKHTLNEITDYKEPHIPTKVSELDNDKNYLTEHQSLEAYATKTFVNNAVANVEVDLTGYATQTFVNNKVAVVSSDLTSYVDTTIPKKVSELQNDANYLVTVPEEYVTDTELEDKHYATHSFVADVLSNIEGGVAFSDDGNGNVLISPATADSYVNDFSNYYTKAEIDERIPENFIAEIPDYYVTETELEEKGYLTEHQSLASYATKQYVTDSLIDVATKNYVDTAFNGANKAVSFSDYSAMVTALNSASETAYQIGQNIMIVTLAVPDLWVSNISETSSPYTYTTDTAITDTIKANGVVQVGYYTLSALETQKVDLTDYNTSTEVDGKIADAVAGVAETRVKEDTTISINVTNNIPVLNYVYTNPITAISSMNTNRVQGHSFQIKTAVTCTVTDTSTWIGDDCADGVFTPVANTNYEIYSYYNQVADKVINMVMNLGA